MNHQELEVLIKGCKGNCQRSQSALYKHYYKKFERVANKYCDDSRDIEEVINEAFTRIFAQINNYDYRGPFEAWMRKIALNSTIDKVRTLSFKQNETNIILTEFGNEHSNTLIVPEEFFNMKQEVDVLLEKLSPQERNVMSLSIIGAKTCDIANELNITATNVRYQLFSARKKIKKYLWF
jgi:RNA polymerase sigma-70 factor (ECF subfamily)